MPLSDESRMPFDSTGLPSFDAWNPGASLRPEPGAFRDGSTPTPAAGGYDETVARPDLSGSSPLTVGGDFLLADAPAAPPPPPAGPGRLDIETAVVEFGAKGKQDEIPFPRLGEAIGGFRLISELGRGAFARVYLAHELALGCRPVALKVSKAEGDEPRILARLQHTHIVPIHSLHDDPVTRLRLICMPYLGGANLAQVLEATGMQSRSQTRGRSLVDALDLVGHPAVDPTVGRRPRAEGVGPAVTVSPEGGTPADPGPHPSHAATLHRSLLGRIPWWPRTPSADGTAGGVPAVDDAPGQPARRFLRESSFVRASVWIVARLAEGLEHAHSRNLLHRDLKPPNILIAADGTPMLLDFNLAADAIELAGDGDEGGRAKMGGTLPYMAPEHLDAFNPRGSTAPGAVDERSDLYALGLILFEMIAGRPAFPDPPPGLALVAMLSHLTAERRRSAPSLRAALPEVAWSLDSIVAKCLAPDPDRRYRSAGDLAEDLRRFLDDLPLEHAPEPSLRERLGKWSRRHPRASSAWTIGPVAAALLIGVGAIAVAQADRLQRAGARLQLRRFVETFGECQFLLNTSSGGDLTDHLRRGVERAKLAIDRYRIDRPGDWQSGYWVAPLGPEDRLTLRRDLAELIVLEARAGVILAVKEGTEADRRAALERAVTRLDRAETFDPIPSPALLSDRANYHRALGRADLARRDLARAEATPAASCRDEYLLGTADLAAGRLDRAEAHLARAVALDEHRFWAWYALGLCHLDQGRAEDAAAEFGYGMILAPQFAWPFASRGQALALAGRLVEAVGSFDRAIAMSPEFAQARAGRGLALLGLGRFKEAEVDLSRAIALGSRDPNVHAGRAEALSRLGRPAEAMRLYDALIADRPDLARLRVARGMARLRDDPSGAEADFLDALRLEPGLAVAHFGLARLFYKADPTRALDRANRAMEADPRLLDALELRALILARLGRADAADDVDRLVKAPTPNRLYNAACAMAVLSKTRPDPRSEDRAVGLLRRAIEAGFPAPTARDDPDLAPLHARHDFRILVSPSTASR